LGTQAEPPAPLVMPKARPLPGFSPGRRRQTFTPTRCWSQRANSLLRLHRLHAQYMAGLAHALDLWHLSR
jgi:hypothetical protein